MKYGSLNTAKSWRDILAELVDELRKWGLDDYVLPTKRESEERGAVILKLAKNGVRTDVPCARFSHEWNGMERNLAGIKEAVKANRLADQRGIGAVFAEVAKLLALPSGDQEDPYAVLGISPGVDTDHVKSAYRSRLFDTHPDRGGKREDYDRVRAAGMTLGVAG